MHTSMAFKALTASKYALGILSFGKKSSAGASVKRAIRASVI
jgi:hypothetical protein